MKSWVARGRRLVERGMDTVPGRVARRFGEDRATNQAVLIAWSLLFSIFPIILALVGLIGLLLGHAGLATQARIESVVLSQMPGDAAGALDTVKQQSGIFVVVGLAGLVWSGSALFGAMEQAFDVVYRVPQRSFVRQKLMAVVMMLVFGALGAVLILSSTLLGALSFLPDALVSAAPVQPVFGVVVGCALFAAVYLVVPNRHLRLRDVWPGAVLAGVAFYALSLLFPLYLDVAGRGMNQYGKGLAVVFVLMTWAYFVGLITVLGVELNAVLFEAGDAGDAVPEAAPSSGVLRRRSPPRRPRPAGGGGAAR